MTGAAKGTVLKLLIDLGTACSIEQDHLMRDLTCERIQCDEIWSFVGAKEKHVRPEKRDEYGDIWTWVAIDADTKLVPSYLVGSRDLGSAVEFMNDLATRLRYRVQLTTDGHRPYLTAVPSAFGDDVDVDYAQLVKLYGPDPTAPDHRYSPPVCTSVSARKISGDPDPAFVSTSYVERSNLTMRMSLRRFTRLTNAHSKKIANHAAAVSLHFAYYNLCRVHASLNKTTPAVAAGVTDHVWALAELIGLLGKAERVPIRRGSYKKRQAPADN